MVIMLKGGQDTGEQGWKCTHLRCESSSNAYAIAAENSRLCSSCTVPNLPPSYGVPSLPATVSSARLVVL